MFQTKISMNYLAHLFLSGSNAEIIVGNMAEDFITGRISHTRNEFLTETMKIGVGLHRQIDTFTDSHEDVKEVKKLFRDEFGIYSPIIVDVLFDYCLLTSWNQFSDEEFQTFKQRIYTIVPLYVPFYPEKMKELLFSMVKHDWLGNYQYKWGLERAFLNLNQRLHYKVSLEKSLLIWEENLPKIHSHFVVFFEELVKLCSNYLEENSIQEPTFFKVKK